MILSNILEIYKNKFVNDDFEILKIYEKKSDINNLDNIIRYNALINSSENKKSKKLYLELLNKNNYKEKEYYEYLISIRDYNNAKLFLDKFIKNIDYNNLESIFELIKLYILNSNNNYLNIDILIKFTIYLKNNIPNNIELYLNFIKDYVIQNLENKNIKYYTNKVLYIFYSLVKLYNSEQDIIECNIYLAYNEFLLKNYNKSLKILFNTKIYKLKNKKGVLYYLYANILSKIQKYNYIIKIDNIIANIKYFIELFFKLSYNNNYAKSILGLYDYYTNINDETNLNKLNDKIIEQYNKNNNDFIIPYIDICIKKKDFNIIINIIKKNYKNISEDKLYYYYSSIISNYKEKNKLEDFINNELEFIYNNINNVYHKIIVDLIKNNFEKDTDIKQYFKLFNNILDKYNNSEEVFNLIKNKSYIYFKDIFSNQLFYKNYNNNEKLNNTINDNLNIIMKNYYKYNNNDYNNIFINYINQYINGNYNIYHIYYSFYKLNIDYPKTFNITNYNIIKNTMFEKSKTLKRLDNMIKNFSKTIDRCPICLDDEIVGIPLNCFNHYVCIDCYIFGIKDYDKCVYNCI